MISVGLKLIICLGLVFCRDVALTEPNQTTDSIARESETLRRQVELQRVSAIDSNQSTQTDVLRQIVGQLQSLQWPAGRTVSARPRTAEKPQEEKIQAAKMIQASAAAASLIWAKNKESGTPPICSLDEVKNPVNVLAAADALYRAKNYVQATRFYEMAVESKRESDPLGRQWAMYQAANCLRQRNLGKAVEGYNRLIAEYPNSPWASAALAQRKNLDWLKQNQPVLSKSITNNDPNQR